MRKMLLQVVGKMKTRFNLNAVPRNVAAFSDLIGHPGSTQDIV